MHITLITSLHVFSLRLTGALCICRVFPGSKWVFGAPKKKCSWSVLPQLRIEQTRRHAYQVDYYWSKQNEGSAVAYLKHTIENIFADMHVMNTVLFFLFFFPSQTFFCLRRLGFVIGVQENGVGARPHFLYAGKTLIWLVWTRSSSIRWHWHLCDVRDVFLKWNRFQLHAGTFYYVVLLHNQSREKYHPTGNSDLVP